MAYFNFKLANSRNISHNDIINLQLIKQNKYEDLSDFLKEIRGDLIEDYISKGYAFYIKGGNKQTTLQKLRLSKKGDELLDLISTPDVINEDLIILEWLLKVYRSEDKLIGNRKRIASGIAHFRVETGLQKNNLAKVIHTFINDEKTFEYSKKLENLFFNNKNIFQRRFVLEDCRLYEYYITHKDFFDKMFN